MMLQKEIIDIFPSTEEGEMFKLKYGYFSFAEDGDFLKRCYGDSVRAYRTKEPNQYMIKKDEEAVAYIIIKNNVSYLLNLKKEFSKTN